MKVGRPGASRSFGPFPRLLPRHALASPVVRVAPPLLSQPPPLCCLSTLPPSGILRRGASCPVALPFPYRLMSPLPTQASYLCIEWGFSFVCFVLFFLFPQKELLPERNSGAGCSNILFCSPTSERQVMGAASWSSSRWDQDSIGQCLGVWAWGAVRMAFQWTEWAG